MPPYRPGEVPVPRDYGRTLEQANACCHAGMGIFMKKAGQLAAALQQAQAFLPIAR
jgi:hypothetical protein